MSHFWKDHCGVFAVIKCPCATPLDLCKTAIKGLQSLQHRGQDSAGISVCTQSPSKLLYRKQLGLVDPEKLYIKSKKRSEANDFAHVIGHVRYATSGNIENLESEIQPFTNLAKEDILAFAHNGHIQNVRELKSYLKSFLVECESQSDSFVIFKLLQLFQKRSPELNLEIMVEVFSMLKGAFSCVVQTKTRVFAIRDSLGIRPLVLGQIEGHVVIASEDSVLKRVGAEVIREIQRGEIVEFSLHKSNIFEKNRYLPDPQNLKFGGPQSAHCIFEAIYFADQKSTVFNIPVAEFRKKTGIGLAKIDLIKKLAGEVDAIIAVPDGGILAAQGVADEFDMALTPAILKRLPLRSFIATDTLKREKILKHKFEYITELIVGKTILLVDDSLVRGATLKRVVSELKKRGAKKIHVLLAAPPILHPCFYGIDTPDSSALLAANMNNLQMCAFLGVDSITFQSRDGLDHTIKGVALSRNMNLEKDFCSACLDGKYPTKIVS